MKLLIVSQYFWPETFAINGLVDLLGEQGIDVTVLTGKPNYPDGDVFLGYRALGTSREHYGLAEVIRVPISPRGKKAAWRLALNYISFIASGVTLGPWLLRGRQFDAVFVYAPSPILQVIPAVLLARLHRAPLVVWVQDLWPQSLSATGHIKNRLVLKAVEWLVRQIYRSADRLLVQSRAFVQPVAELTADPSKIHYFPNLGPRNAVVSYGTERAIELARLLSGSFTVVFAGNLGSAQALDTIVDAAKLLRPHASIKVALIGSGSLDDWLKEQRILHGLDNLYLPGRFDPSDMPTIFGAAAALLVTLKPDPTFDLTIPSKVQAYLAAGRPIVAALDGEGAKVIEESKAGLCTPAGDATALASSILRLARMPITEREEMARAGRNYFVAHFDPDILIGELKTHLTQTIAKFGDRA
ncbi:glycosyltransferase family 4 protein (plasmid) [Rhizobium sp. WL3]|uniref:glycosyltransferase family 4 protein n=1 Tax=Rhizobium sp. WL3 TaxID=2603277 RepID=UPI0011C1D9D8|nr:glycosyltransferase family 4 protein [Rhizobium sp. WL3]QEE43684.1 glycosyltransferase family 4 protein [Rhizobium sp. WL3]